MIFDTTPRTDASPKLHAETEFAFLNRSAREEMHLARSRLEALVAIYPDPDDLVRRFQSGNDTHFHSAEFELLLFALLSNRGFKLAPHPALPGRTSRPDFLVESPSGDEFYLEAVLASEDQGGGLYQHPLVATTLDIFSSNYHRNFLVMVSTSGQPTTQPSRNALLRKTLAWLDGLDPDAVLEAMEAGGHEMLPSLDWAHEDLMISLKAFPLSKGARGQSTRLLAGQMGRAGWVDSWSPIRDAIRFKGSKYGTFDRPFVVAVNFGGYFLNRIDEMQALFGQEQVTVSITDRDAPARLSRAPNGAWIGNSGPQFKRVSAAWLFDGLNVYNLESRKPTLYLHPWANYPVTADLLQFPHAIGEDGTMSWHEGTRPGPLFPDL
ncbi:MAG: hypothetical protein ACTHK2_05765 [Dokdonella sp.]|uniref:hypothetical protein n=1 Tax=Dokdonella sp. TaxID=2291710 RepID=UPI003F7E1D90